MAPLSGDDPRHLGGFRVLTVLAVGGMGRVYLALGPDRRAVALKVARPEFAADPRFRARFRREVATAREVGGGGSLIAPVVAADPEAETPWLASEYVPGPSVTDVAMGFGPLSAAGLRTLTHGLARALAEVHAAGVVHRDVKPSNVLLARDGPRLIDFGVARAVDDLFLTRVGALIGSPGFLSPEQAVGEPVTFGSDVFAMAAVVAYAARGQSPFGAGDGPALLYRVVHERPKLDGLPADLAEVLAACLTKDPAGRPSAEEVAARVGPAEPWLPEAVLEDIARREAELAAWLKVTAADPLWVRAVSEAPASWSAQPASSSAQPASWSAQTSAFDTVADSALDIANAAVRAGLGPDPSGRHTRGPSRQRASKAQPGVAEAGLDQASSSRPDSPAHGIRQPGLPRTSDAPSGAGTEPGAAYEAFLLDPDPPLPAATHRAPHPQRHRFPVYAALGALVGAAATAAVLLLPHSGHSGPSTPGPSPSPSTVPGGDGKAAPSTPTGGRSGSAERPKTTSASGSRR